MSAVAYVYGLRFHKPGHPHDGLIRYVGKALNPARRFARHKSPSEGHGAVARAMRKHGTAAFTQEILQCLAASTLAEADALALEAERRWIARLNTAHGRYGLNLTEGGEGARLFGPALERQRAGAREHMRELHKRPDVLAQYSKIARERFDVPGYLERWRAMVARRNADSAYVSRHRAAMQLLHSDPAHRAKISATLRATRQQPEFIEKWLPAVRAANADPVNIEKRAATQRRNATPEVRARKSAVATELHQDPEFSAKYRQGLSRKHADPVYAAQHAEQTRQRHADPVFGLQARAGIALHWAQKHQADGAHAAARAQIDKLVLLMGQLPDSSRVKISARQYLDAIPMGSDMAPVGNPLAPITTTPDEPAQLALIA